MDYNLDFSGKVVIVTGAASGIGKATSLAFIERGAKVALVDINRDKGLRLSKAINRTNGTSIFIESDTAQLSDIDNMIKVVMKKLGCPDILVNNAGIEFNDRGNLVDMPYTDLKHILDVNLYGYIHCVRSIVPYMPSGAKIVNVSSVQGLAVDPPGTSYQVSKSAIFGLTRVLAIELASKGINVNAVAPGGIATEGMGAMRTGKSDILDCYRRRTPQGRRGWPEEVAGPILFLCSSLASYITGTTLVIDGGYLINLAPDTGGLVLHLPNDPD